MGVVPSSINVPLLLASIIRSQYIGSDVSDETMPYSGIWLMTRNIKSVHCRTRQLCSRRVLPRKHTPVHINFWLKLIFDSGAATSGRRGVKGLMRSRNRRPDMIAAGVEEETASRGRCWIDRDEALPGWIYCN
jgi:hypothetical protein